MAFLRLSQLRQVRKMGPLQNIVKMMPGLPKELKQAQVDESEIAKVEAIICAMTPAERREPSVINGSRRLRIASRAHAFLCARLASRCLRVMLATRCRAASRS